MKFKKVLRETLLESEETQQENILNVLNQINEKISQSIVEVENKNFNKVK